MYIIVIAFLVVFSIGMVACVVYLARVRNSQAVEIINLHAEKAGREHRNRIARKNNSILRRSSNNLKAQNTVLRQELQAAHRNLEMVLDNHRPLMAGNVGVEIGRNGVRYHFAHADLLESDASPN